MWISAAFLSLALAGQPHPLDDVLFEGLDGIQRSSSWEDLQLTKLRSEGAILVRFPGPADDPAPAGSEQDRAVINGEGDRVEGWIAGGEGDRLNLTLAGGTALTLLVDEVASLVLPGRIPRDADTRPEPAEEGDRLYILRGGGLDRLDGLLHEFSEVGIVFESRLGLETYAWDRAVALFIEVFEEPPSESEDVQAGPEPVVVDLRGGSRLRGGLVRLDRNGLVLETPAQPELSLPPASLASIALDDGSFRFLSELGPSDLGPLSPTGDELGMTWPPRFDRSVDGGPLRAGGRIWARGIGVHAPSRLAWKIEGRWAQLRARAALDASRRGGTAIFRVYVDGELRFESPLMNSESEPLTLPNIDLSEAAELVLEVDPTEDLWIGDRALWLAPLLIAAPSSR